MNISLKHVIIMTCILFKKGRQKKKKNPKEKVGKKRKRGKCLMTMLYNSFLSLLF